MTRRIRTNAEAKLAREQLESILRDMFQNNGPLVTHDALAKEHVRVNASVTAAEDVAQFGGSAINTLRREDGFAIVPVTSHIHAWTGTPSSEEEIADTIAGNGAGGARVGWYQPTTPDDWLYVYYIGHRVLSGMAAVFHASDNVNSNPTLQGPTMLPTLKKLSVDKLPAPASAVERPLLTADAKRK